MSEVIEVDCIVRRSSGGPQMLVLAVNAAASGGRSIAQCAWFEGGSLDSAGIAIDQLTVITPTVEPSRRS